MREVWHTCCIGLLRVGTCTWMLLWIIHYPSHPSHIYFHPLPIPLFFFPINVFFAALFLPFVLQCILSPSNPSIINLIRRFTPSIISFFPSFLAIHIHHFPLRHPSFHWITHLNIHMLISCPLFRSCPLIHLMFSSTPSAPRAPVV